MPRDELLTIGKLFERTGVNIETIRYYEREGLLSKPERSGGGFRLYPPPSVDRLTFIRRARDLGFSLDEVRRLLDLADRKSRSCHHVHELANAHLADVRAKLADLRRMARVLADLVEACRQGTVPDCPLLDALSRSRLPLAPKRAVDRKRARGRIV